jgi:hypothetical protein
MKTLRNTLIIVMVAISLGFVNVFAQKKVEKFKARMVVERMSMVNEKVRNQSEEALRNVITDVLSNATIYESGRVNIVFKVSGGKRVEVLNVFGTNPALVSSVKYEIGKSIIMVPEALEGKYMIAVLF